MDVDHWKEGRTGELGHRFSVSVIPRLEFEGKFAAVDTLVAVFSLDKLNYGVKDMYFGI